MLPASNGLVPADWTTLEEAAQLCLDLWKIWGRQQSRYASWQICLRSPNFEQPRDTIQVDSSRIVAYFPHRSLCKFSWALERQQSKEIYINIMELWFLTWQMVSIHHCFQPVRWRGVLTGPQVPLGSLRPVCIDLNHQIGMVSWALEVLLAPPHALNRTCMIQE